MHRHITLKNISSIKYYTNIPIDTFKRWSLPANDNLMRRGDLYKFTFLSIKKQGLLDPVFCYDVINVDLNNPPTYHKNRKIWGLYLIRGNIRWLCCKDLGIETMNAIIVSVDHGKKLTKKCNLFEGTNIQYSSVKPLYTAEDINNCYTYYCPNTKIYSNHIEMHIPSLLSVAAYGIIQEDALNFNWATDTIDYAKVQRSLEMNHL